MEAIALKVQVQIDPRKRSYSQGEAAKLVDLFGGSERWAETLRAVHWTHASVMVPAFTGTTEVDIPIPCTYDFEVASSKYFDAMEEGEVPLLLLFSGMVFTKGEAGFAAEMVPWNLECTFRMPARLWREAMDHFFPNQAWIRLSKETFDELNRFKTEHGLLSWEHTLERLLAASAERV